jgi:chaperonin GroES
MSGELVVIGDRLLVSPATEKTKTESGLYLPQGLASKEKVQTGRVVKVGPGYVLPHSDSSEPWQGTGEEPKYVPLQVQEGDFAIFLRREAIEIEYKGDKYLIVQQGGVLAVVRDDMDLDSLVDPGAE